jgi:hypothetical protein
MVPRKRVASGSARSSRRGLPRGLDGFEPGRYRGSYLKRRLSARRAIHLHAAVFLVLSAVTATADASGFVVVRHERISARFELNKASPGTPPTIFRIQIRTRINPSGFFHKLHQPRSGHIAMSNIPQRTRPFADHLTIGVVVTSAANDG